MQIRESAEDYLEAILILKEEKGIVRSIDVANRLGFSKPSVSRAVGLLRENGYITTDQDGWIELTESGMGVAAHVYERHRLLTQWFIRLGVDPETAVADACRVEHDLSDITFQRLKTFIESTLTH